MAAVLVAVLYPVLTAVLHPVLYANGKNLATQSFAGTIAEIKSSKCY